MTFPAAVINSTSVVTVVVANRGSGAGSINSVMVTGAGFQPQALPAMPASVDSGKDLRFGIAFTPRQAGVSTGVMQIALPDRVIAVDLQGSASTADFAVSYFLESDGNNVMLSPGGQLAFPPTSINAFARATVVISYRGTGTGTVNSVSLAGDTFRLLGLPPLPAILDPGKELRLGVVYSPRQAGNSTGSLSLYLSDRVFVVQVTGSTTDPDFKITYSLQADGNVISLGSGGTLTFPSTKVAATSTAIIAVANYGKGGGYVNSVSLTGQDFQLLGLALLPIFVEPGKELRFVVTYAPKQIGTAEGSLKVVVDDRTFLVNLAGTSTGPMFTYAVVKDGAGTPLQAKDTLSLPETALRETSSVVVQVTNAGNADGVIAGISVAGQGFQLSGLPILPFVLAPNAAVTFNLLFAPAQPGSASGRLQIGTDTFDLVASAKGPKLVYSYRNGAGSVAMQDNRTVLWGPVQVGQTSQVDFVVRNEGTSTATITSVVIVDAKSAYRLKDVPELPALLPAGDQVAFSLLFSPAAVGDNVARLRVEGEIFNLVGSGTPPPPLPAVELRGPVQGDAMQQPALSLALATPYPLPLSGTLTMTVNSSSFSVDPTVQFATGGRSVAFTIPANTTQAQFPTGSEIRFQTGTVAGTISVSASFATTSGVNVTPDAPPTMSVTVPPSPPRVLDVRFDARSSTSFVVVITGLSTTRSLTQLELEFAASQKFQVPAGRFTLNLDSASTAWYRSVESQSYGSLCTVSIPFTVQGEGSPSSLEEVFQSISATLTNEKGRSNTLSIAPHP